jgi:hypothetical protein
MFAPGLAADKRLLPKGNKLVHVRVDELPEPKAIKAAWKAYWQAEGDAYEWNPDAAPFKRGDG